MLLCGWHASGGRPLSAGGGAAFIATTLFKAFLVEARQPALLSYTDILTNILTRTDQGRNPLIEVRAEDLVHGGVP